MNRNHLLLAALLAGAPLLTACGNSAGASASAADTARVAQSDLLPLPEVPDSIFDPLERADYVVLHYWDTLSPDDPRASDREFIDANFAQYAEQFLYASDSGAAYAVATLVAQTKGYPEQLKLLAEMANKYFNRRGAATYSERSYIIWAKELLDTDVLSDADRTRITFLLRAASKNAPGTIASDFQFTDRNGTSTSLHALRPVPYTLLVFYDPDCETCHEIIDKVRGDSKLMRPVDAGQVRVLLIDVADDRAAFRTDAAGYPQKWTVGYDDTRIDDNDVYIFDTTPAIYLLDSKYKVILKDATIDQLIDYAKSLQ